ncbi:MAG: prepilin-type N-terminal cleavage/methylation domain-containing protein [Bacilli bacterium]|jgi:type IV pilus assembly protein PilA|nr:prepilin-type N-terminal cleavage/methylation domain-containing protein [Bacilli bacterium]
MLEQKGFTLIELLAVIAILAIISLIAIPAINKTTDSSRDKIYDTQIANLKSGGKAWAAEHVAALPENGGSKTLTLRELKQGGYVDSDITNPKTKQKFDDTCTKIIIRNVNGKLIYEVDLSSC